MPRFIFFNTTRHVFWKKNQKKNILICEKLECFVENFLTISNKKLKTKKLLIQIQQHINCKINLFVYVINRNNNFVEIGINLIHFNRRFSSAESI